MKATPYATSGVERTMEIRDRVYRLGNGLSTDQPEGGMERL